MDEQDTEASAKWQPVMVYLRGGGVRLECQCGALAVVVVGTLDEEQYLKNADYWCQACYIKAQAEMCREED